MSPQLRSKNEIKILCNNICINSRCSIFLGCVFMSHGSILYYVTALNSNIQSGIYVKPVFVWFFESERSPKTNRKMVYVQVRCFCPWLVITCLRCVWVCAHVLYWHWSNLYHSAFTELDKFITTEVKCLLLSLKGFLFVSFFFLNHDDTVGVIMMTFESQITLMKIVFHKDQLL